MISLEFSVVIPTYNSAGTLPRAVCSALNQTYPPREIIIIDDGSTDDTSHVVEEIRHKVTFVQQTRGGPSKARNTGAAHCSGDWIAFLDSDDVWLPQKLEKQAALIQANPDLYLLAADYVLREDDAATKTSQVCLPAQVNSEVALYQLQYRTFFLLSSVVVRRVVFVDVGGFNESLVCGEDRELWARIALAGAVDAVHEPLVIKYGLSKSISSSPETVLNYGLAVNRLVHHLLSPASNPLRSRLALREADSLLFWSVAFLYYKSNRIGAAAKMLALSILSCPYFRFRQTLGLLFRVCRDAVRR